MSLILRHGTLIERLSERVSSSLDLSRRRRAAVFCHESVGNHAMFAQGASGADLVEAHEPRVACDVSRDYGGEPASYPSWLVLFHGDYSGLIRASPLSEGLQ